MTLLGVVEEKLLEKEKWIQKKSKDQERVIGAEEMAHWF